MQQNKGYTRFVLFMLTLVYIFNFIDRQILVILQESIKADLNLSDTQLGLLSGLSFAIFYVLMGVPIARLADKRNRKNIIAVSLVFWSGFTALCGLVNNFIQLLFARIGVGIGEAGCSPSAHSMISDYYPEKKRATALSVYSSGIYIGILFGFSLGGWLDQTYGWRIAFIAIGLPGIIFAIIFYLLVKEPKRSPMNSDLIASDLRLSQSTMLSQVIYLFSKPSFVFLCAAVGLHTFSSYALGNWLPAFLSRIHGLSTAQIGLYAGLIIGIAGALGTLVGGYLADRLSVDDKSWYMKVPGYAALIALPFLLIYYLYPTVSIALAALFIAYACLSSFLAPSIAITHSLVPDNMRAFSSSILFLVLNLVGLGFGPLVVGMISDYLAPSYGAESIRWALVATLVVNIAAIGLFFMSAKHLKNDLTPN